MNYSGNMPDWHQYNPPQAGRTSVPAAGAQNANTSQHIYIPGISPPSLDGMNLTTDRHRTSKHQNEPSYIGGRNYPGGTMAHLTTPLAGCVGHYGPTSGRNPMMDSHLAASTAIDSRMVPSVAPSINEDVASHRNAPMTFATPSHPNGASGMGVNSSSGMHATTIGSQNSPIRSMSPARQAPSAYGTCKAPCCNPDPNNIPYQHWDKFAHYPNVATSYRDNIRQSAYPIDNRRFLSDMNLRKDCLDNKDLVDAGAFPVDHRTGNSNSGSSNTGGSSGGRNFTEYNKYTRKESVVPRNYPPPPPVPSNSLLHQNFPMQNYNFPSDYQKYPYSIKDYTRRVSSSNNSNSNNSGSINPKNPGIIKYHQEQQSVLVQQKYHQHSKQIQYQNGASPTAVLSTSTAPGTNVITSSHQNSYFNVGQLPRDLSRDYSRDYHQPPQDQSVVTNRMAQGSASSHVHGSFQKYHVYHHKLAMHRFTLENHMRAFSRIPGYQSHPKYQECVMRYHELLRLQQSVEYQSVIQEPPKVPSPASNGPVAPINLQFDQNGVLINSSYIHPGASYPGGIHTSGLNHSAIPTASSEITGDSSSTSNNGRVAGTSVNFETPSHFVGHSQDLDTPRVATLHEENSDRYFMPNDKNDTNGQYDIERLQNTRESVDSINASADGIETTKSSDDSSTGTTMTTIAHQNSKDFADKPELDVRQFLANWDESEDEDTTTATTATPTTMTTNIPNITEDSAIDEQEQPSDSSVDINLQSEDKTESSVPTSLENPTIMTVESPSNNDNVSTMNNSPSDSHSETEIVSKDSQEIECIRTEEDLDDIPTIHIVESLEAGSEMEKIHTVFGNLASSVLNPISIGSSATCEIVAEAGSNENGKTIILFEQEDVGVCTETNDEVVEGVIAAMIESSTISESATSQEPTNDNETLKVTPEEQDSIDRSVEQETTTTTSMTTTTTTTTTTTKAIITTTTASSSSSVSSYNSSVTNSVASTSSCSSKSNSIDTTNLRKQNSFTSDESHNPDDISLPDLQTSECTPISTTLNTPIQSDSEESSEHVTDLTISTNPIEIIQNSPIISFTHSPIKIEPYEQLEAAARIVHGAEVRREHDSLDFDFDEEVASNENRKYNEDCAASPESVVEELENQARNSDAMRIEESTSKNEENEPKEPSAQSYENNENYENTTRAENNFYHTADPLVGMAQLSRTVPNETNNLDDSSKEIANPCVEGNVDENGRIELDTNESPTVMEQTDQDDFNRSEDLEKLCEISLDGSCMIPLIPGDDCEEPRMPVSPMEGNCLTNILNDTLPITNLDMLESSDNDTIDKSDDDIWGEVRNMDKHFETNSSLLNIESNKLKRENAEKSNKTTKPTKVTRLDISLSSSPTKFEHHFDDKNNYDIARKEEDCKSSNFSQVQLDADGLSSPLTVDEIAKSDYKDCKERNVTSTKISKNSDKDHFEENVINEETRKTRVSCDERINSQDEKESFAISNVDKIDEARNTNETMSYFTNRRDSNVEIKVANLNVKIHNDNEAIRGDATCLKKNQESNVEGIDAIEIKINLSRGDRRSNKSLHEKFTEEVDESDDTTMKKLGNSLLSCSSINMCCRRRRRSLPDTNDERSGNFDHYVPTKISKSRNTASSDIRRKVRRSMDDALLCPISEERLRKDGAPIEDKNYQKEIIKAFNIAWPREQESEAINESISSSLTRLKDDETIKTKSSSSKNKIDSRTVKYSNDSTCRLPSPSYNSLLESSSTLDFDNFDVAPNRRSSETDNEKTDDYTDGRSRLDERDRYRNPTNYANATSCFDGHTPLDAFEINLNTVPIYTTKDGRITYSPNRNYTYRALITEARQREQRYPGIGKFNYSRHLSRNNYRETYRKNMYKRRSDEKKHWSKIVDCHAVKGKRSTTPSRRRSDETTRKHEIRRSARVSSDLLEKYYSDEQIPKVFPEHEGRSVSTTSSSLKSEKSSQMNFTMTRRSEDTSNREVDLSSRNLASNLCKGKSSMANGDDETVDDLSRSPKHFVDHETEMCLVSTIFQDQELEISSRKATNDVAGSEREICRQNSRFFQDTSHALMKTPMASPMMTPNTTEKRTIGGWDLDCQTALSDSGLESSTTYIEASKESRRNQRWKTSLCVDGRLESVKSLHSIITRNKYADGGYDFLTDKQDNIAENTTLRYFDDETRSSKIVSSESAMVVESKAVDDDEPTKRVIAEVVDDAKQADKIALNAKNFTAMKMTISGVANKEMSEIVNSLDLAITPSTLNDPMRNERETENSKIIKNVNTQNTISKTTFRRVSSDAVNSEESRRSFFRDPTLSDSLIAKLSQIRDDPVKNNEDEDDDEQKNPIESKETDDGRLNEISEEITENSITNGNFNQPCKDFLIDSSTSFSSCMKLRVPEPVSELPSESEASGLEDTSTRFASESMDFKEFGTDENIVSFASQINPSGIIIDNGTTVRDSSLFANIAENAMCVSNDSEGSKKSPSGKAPILSFSGQIQNDSRLIDSPSKSPPDLTNESSMPVLVIKKNEIASKASPPLLDETFEFPILEKENTNTLPEQEITAHPKIPKMIIRNVKSRPGTPTPDEDNNSETSTTTPTKSLFLRDQRPIFEVATKLEKSEESRVESGECKIPKMKIKLEDKQLPRMITENARGKKMDDLPRVKIKKVRKSSTSRSPVGAEKLPLVGKLSRQSSESDVRLDFPEIGESSNTSSSYKFTLIEKSSTKYHHHHHHYQSSSEKTVEESKQDKIPKLTIKKQDVAATSSSTYSSCPSINKKHRSRSPGESSSKKQRRIASKVSSNGKKGEVRSRERRRNSLDSNEGNTDSHQSLSEKIPKVIIKRTSASAEFKCELSQNDREAITKDSKWQPEVKIQRSWVLDCMAKEPGNGQVALKVLESTMENINREANVSMEHGTQNSKWKRSSSDSLIRKVGSVHDGKVRRKSDCENSSRVFSTCTTRRKSLDEYSESLYKFESLPASSTTENPKLPTILKTSSFQFSTSRSGSPANKSNDRDDEKKITEKDKKLIDGENDKSAKKIGNSFDEPVSSVIKLDSSDESQTTIEILPASPDNSQTELEMSNQSFQTVRESIGNGNMGKLYTDDAIPTQFELELEIVDNSTVDPLDVPLPLPDHRSSLEDDTVPDENIHDAKSLDSHSCSKNKENDNHESKKISAESYQAPSITVEASMKSICCSDSLVKEVLAAKETLKRCLTKSNSIVRRNHKPRPKTAAEKKQGLGCDFPEITDFSDHWKCENETLPILNDNVKSLRASKPLSAHEDRKMSVVISLGGRESDHRTGENSKSSWKNEERQESMSSNTIARPSKRSAISSTNSRATKTGKSSENESSGKNSKTQSTSAESNGTSVTKTRRSSKSMESSPIEQGVSNLANSEDSAKNIKSYKIPKISRSRERNYTSNDANANDEKRKSPSPVKMPVLEPQIDLNFEIAGSDRDTSRSPPVITKQEESEVDNQVPKKLEEKVNSDKLDGVIQQRDTEAVTFANTVSQLAYHEKATIRHRRYCTLCERWFPTAARHRRHLTGYQHRHTELTQRRTVHALFMLFTGKPCPRLLPASIVRTDCLPGEPTPLQIAVQDVAISLEDSTRVKPNKDASEKDE